MEMTSCKAPWYAYFIAIVLTALAYFYATGLNPYWWLLWLAPLPIMLLAYRSSTCMALISAFLAYFLGNFAQLSMIATHVPLFLKPLIPSFPFILNVIVHAIVFAIAIGIARYIVLRLKHWTAIFAFPAVWTTFEYLYASLSAMGTNTSIANTQLHWLALMQITSITGIWGITFLISLIPSALSMAWLYRHINRECSITILIPGILLLLTLFYGYTRLDQEQIIVKTVHVALAATDGTIKNLRSTKPKQALQVARDYSKLVRKLVNRGAKIVLLPEKIIRVTPHYFPNVLNIFSNAAASNKVMLILGVAEVAEKRGQNTALIFSPSGKLLIRYQKHHPTRFVTEKKELPGKRYIALRSKYGNMGVAIAHDMDFQSFGRTYGRAGVGIMFVPALDFVVDRWLHARVAIIQGIENGYAVVRAAQWGLLSVTDYRGKIIAIQTTKGASPSLLTAEVTPGPGRTFYSKAGDWFAWLSILLLIVLVAVASLKLSPLSPSREG